MRDTAITCQSLQHQQNSLCLEERWEIRRITQLFTVHTQLQPSCSTYGSTVCCCGNAWLCSSLSSKERRQIQSEVVLRTTPNHVLTGLGNCRVCIAWCCFTDDAAKVKGVITPSMFAKSLECLLLLFHTVWANENNSNESHVAACNLKITNAFCASLQANSALCNMCVILPNRCNCLDTQFAHHLKHRCHTTTMCFSLVSLRIYGRIVK